MHKSQNSIIKMPKYSAAVVVSLSERKDTAKLFVNAAVFPVAVC